MSLFKTENNDPIDSVIADVRKKLEGFSPDSDEFAACIKQLDTLYKMRSYDKDNRVNVNTLIAAGANLLGIVAILSFERVNVITSKAIGFVVKSRL